MEGCKYNPGVDCNSKGNECKDCGWNPGSKRGKPRPIDVIMTFTMKSSEVRRVIDALEVARDGYRHRCEWEEADKVTAALAHMRASE